MSALFWSRRQRARWLRGGVAMVIAAVVAASTVGVARAQDTSPNPGASSVDQYVELVPTAGGPKAPGIGSERRTPLPPIAKRALDKASESTADSLGTIATSSNYGAPPAPRPGATERVVRDAPALDRTLQAIAIAATPVGDARLIGLLSILAVVTVGGSVLAVRRRLEPKRGLGVGADGSEVGAARTDGPEAT